MQMTFAVVAPQSTGMAYPTERTSTQDPGSKKRTWGTLLHSILPEKCRSDILSTIPVSTNKDSSNPGHPPWQREQFLERLLSLPQYGIR